MKRAVQSIIVLTAICLLTTVILATINYITSPIIEAAEKEAEIEALKIVLPSGKDFEELSVEGDLPDSINKIYKETSGDGYVFRMTVKGYSKGLTVLCGVSTEGRVTGAVCLSSSETLGHEKDYGESFIDLDASSVPSVDTVSGATMTTKAYRSAVSDALSAFETIKSK